MNSVVAFGFDDFRTLRPSNFQSVSGLVPLRIVVFDELLLDDVEELFLVQQYARDVCRLAIPTDPFVARDQHHAVLPGMVDHSVVAPKFVSLVTELPYAVCVVPQISEPSIPTVIHLIYENLHGRAGAVGNITLSVVVCHYQSLREL